MYQIYFLSISTNLLAGMVLASEGMDDKLRLSSLFNKQVIEKTGFRIGIGVVTFITGIFKFLSVTQGDVPVVGDLLPALSGIILGLILLLQYYRSKSDVSSQTVDALEKVFGQNSAVFGTLGMVIAVLHFLFPRVLLL